MRVLGIDPGTTHLGAAILEDESCVWHAHLSSHDVNRYCHDDQMCRWWLRLRGIVRRYRPEVVVYEDYVF